MCADVMLEIASYAAPPRTAAPKTGSAGVAVAIGGLFLIIAVAVIFGLIWGFITKYINESKGYSGGFAWGFFLGLIGLIVVACKNDIRQNNMQNYRQPQQNGNSQGGSSSNADELVQYKKLMDDGVITPEEFEVKKKQLLKL